MDPEAAQPIPTFTPVETPPPAAPPPPAPAQAQHEPLEDPSAEDLLDAEIVKLEAEREVALQTKLGKLRRLAGYQPRYEWFDVPEPYESWRVEIWVNPSDNEVELLGQSPLWRYVQHFVRAWEIHYADGTPVPLTKEGIRDLPNEIIQWITVELARARNHPLAMPRPPTSRDLLKVAGPPTGGSGSKSLNGLA